jgi:MFS family permease
MGGIGMNLLYTPSVLAVGFYFEKRRALATSICVCGSGIGQFVFGTLTYFMINAYGWRITMLIEAGIILACSLCTTVYRPLRPKVVKPETSKSTLSAVILKPGKSFDFIGDTPLAELASLATTNDDRAGEEEKFNEIRLGHSVLTANAETGIIELRPEASVGQMNKPLNRDDIYYTGSLTRIAIYADAKKAISGHLTKPAWSVVMSRRQIKRGEQSAKYPRLHKCCRKLRAIGDLMDFTLLTLPKMMLFMLTCFLVSCGFLAPYAFLISIAKKKRE